MNKKKIAALALSGTLLMGAAGFGAYSWFTSSAKVDTNLKITTGEFALSTADNGWKAKTTGTQADIQEVNTGTSEKPVMQTQISKVQAGDILERNVKITSTGDLKQLAHLTIDKSLESKLAAADGAITVSITDKEGKEITDKAIVLSPNDTIDATIKVSINKNLTNERMNKELLDTVTNKTILDVEGTQTNYVKPLGK